MKRKGGGRQHQIGVERRSFPHQACVEVRRVGLCDQRELHGEKLTCSWRSRSQMHRCVYQMQRHLRDEETRTFEWREASSEFDLNSGHSVYWTRHR